MRRSALSLLFGLLLVALASQHNAGGADLLTNGGFEDGVAGWTQSEGALSTVDDPVHGGAAAARFAGDGQPSNQFIYQWVEVTPGNTYQLSGWVVRNDPSIDHIFFRIDWFDETVSFVRSVDSTADPVEKPEFQFLTTTSDNAPANARLARISLRIIATSDFEMFVDDVVFDGPELTPTPSPMTTPSPSPSPPPTPTPTPTPTPAPLPSPTQTPTPTAILTSTPTGTPTPTPPTTFAPTQSPTLSPTPPPTFAPTQTPTPRLTPAPTIRITPTPTRSPTPSPAPSPTQGALEPSVFPSLANGSFEQTRADGTPYGWHRFGGAYAAAQGPAAEGQFSLEMTSSTASTKWVYQSVAVQGGEHYELTALALMNDPRVDALFLRISFYASPDGSGSAIESTDSTTTLDNSEPGFRTLTTGRVRAPGEARSARLRLMLRPVSELPTTAHFDAVTFAQAGAPTATPAPTAMPSPTPTPSPQPTPSPMSPPLTPIPTPLATPAPAESEPTTFIQITNGSFEDRRTDGTPYGWRKVGGEIGVTTDRSAHGGSSLAFDSATGSTKWAYQNIRVEPLGYYDASVQAMVPSPASEAFLRLSWYQSEDGSGPAISSDDSVGTATESSFEFLRTASVHAPADARSVKLKLMLRPGTEGPSTAYFDAVSFSRAAPPAGDQRSSEQSPSGVQPAQPNTPTPPDAVVTSDPTPAALGAVETPRPRVNVTLAPAAPHITSTLGASGSPNYDWAIALAIIVPLIGFAFLGAYELQRPKREPDE